MNLTIKHLVDVPSALPVLARWFIEEWEPHYGPEGPGDAESDLRAARTRDELPICLVALEGSEPVGTIALRKESVPSHRHLSPWLAGLLVAPEHRGKGIGSMLIAELVAEARRLEFKRVYNATESAPHGWRAIDRAPTLRGEVGVFVLDI